MLNFATMRSYKFTCGSLASNVPVTVFAPTAPERLSVNVPVTLLACSAVTLMLPPVHFQASLVGLFWK